MSDIEKVSSIVEAAAEKVQQAPVDEAYEGWKRTRIDGVEAAIADLIGRLGGLTGELTGQEQLGGVNDLAIEVGAKANVAGELLDSLDTTNTHVTEALAGTAQLREHADAQWHRVNPMTELVYGMIRQLRAVGADAQAYAEQQAAAEEAAQQAMALPTQITAAANAYVEQIQR